MSSERLEQSSLSSTPHDHRPSEASDTIEANTENKENILSQSEKAHSLDIHSTNQLVSTTPTQNQGNERASKNSTAKRSARHVVPFQIVTRGARARASEPSQPTEHEESHQKDGRDGGKEFDVEADLLARVLESLRKSKELNDNSRRVGQEIMALEEEIKTVGYSTPDQHRKLDNLYRENMRYAEQEKKIHDDDDIVNNLAILATMKSNDDPAPRNGQPKARKGGQRPTVESDIAVESPGPSPSEGRQEMMKRVKGSSQRTSSVASRDRAATAPKEDNPETNRGILAEKAGQLVIGVEVFYKYPKGHREQEGEGIHGIIKKVWLDKKPIQYDVRDPEDDPSGKQTVRKASARDLVPIPATATNLPVFANGSKVYAKYPDTDTFYNAEVRNFQKGMYTLIFEGEEDNKEMAVDKRFVLDSRLK